MKMEKLGFELTVLVVTKRKVYTSQIWKNSKCQGEIMRGGWWGCGRHLAGVRVVGIEEGKQEESVTGGFKEGRFLPSHLFNN